MSEERCTNVLHIDWEADNDQGYVREDIAQCVKQARHEGPHRGKADNGAEYVW